MDSPRSKKAPAKKAQPVEYVLSANQRRAAVLHGLDYQAYAGLHPDADDADHIVAQGGCLVKHSDQ